MGIDEKAFERFCAVREGLTDFGRQYYRELFEAYEAAKVAEQPDEITETSEHPVAWLRDVDGTGSLHVCYETDPDAVAVYIKEPKRESSLTDELPHYHVECIRKAISIVYRGFNNNTYLSIAQEQELARAALSVLHYAESPKREFSQSDECIMQAAIKEIIQDWKPGENLHETTLAIIDYLSECSPVRESVTPEHNYWKDVFKNADCFERWANANAFWEKQPYGTRFYFGEGAFDYINRGILESAVKQLNQAKRQRNEIEDQEGK